MAVTFGTPTYSSLQSNTTGYSFSHNATGAAGLLVFVFSYDSSTSDIVTSGITFNGGSYPLTQKAYGLSTVNSNTRASIWYIATPSQGNYTVAITQGGKTSYSQAVAINIIGKHSDSGRYVNNDTENGTSNIINLASTITGEILIGASCNDERDEADNTCTSGAVKLCGSDLGSYCGIGGYKVSPSGGITPINFSNPSTMEWGGCVWSILPNVKPDQADLEDPTHMEEISDTTPTLQFYAVDSEGDDVEYQVDVDTVVTFDSQSGSPLIHADSSVDATDFYKSGDTHPYTEGESCTYTVNAGDELTAPNTYYWRVRAKDPTGSNEWGPWSTTWSFDLTSGGQPDYTGIVLDALGANPAVLLAPTISGEAGPQSEIMAATTATVLAPQVFAECHVDITAVMEAKEDVTLLAPSLVISQRVILEGPLEANPAEFPAPKFVVVSLVESALLVASSSYIVLPSVSVYEVLEIEFQSYATAELPEPTIVIYEIAGIPSEATAAAYLLAPSVSGTATVDIEPLMEAKDNVELLVPEITASGNRTVICEGAAEADTAEIHIPVVVIEASTAVGAQQTVTSKPAADTDDVVRVPGWGSTDTGGDGRFGNWNGGGDVSVHFAWRFVNVDIPKNATISSAKVSLWAWETQGNTTCNILIHGESNATPNTFVLNGHSDYDNRTRTSNSVSWNNLPTFTASSWNDSPDISDIVSEITGLAGWSAGNNLVTFFHDNASSLNADRTFHDYGQGGDSTCAVFSATYVSMPNAAASVIAPQVYTEASISAELLEANPAEIPEVTVTIENPSAGTEAIVKVYTNRTTDGSLVYHDYSTDTSGEFDVDTSSLSVSGSKLVAAASLYCVHTSAVGAMCVTAKKSQAGGLYWGGPCIWDGNALDSADDRDGYTTFAQDTGPAGVDIRRENNAAPIWTYQGDGSLPTDASDIIIRLYLDATTVYGRAGATGLGTATVSYGDTGYRTTLYPGMRFINASNCDWFDARTSHEVTVTGLPSGWYAEVDDGTTQVNAQESSGTATINAGSVLFPLSSVKVYDGDPDTTGSLIADITESNSGGGDEFEYVAGLSATASLIAPSVTATSIVEPEVFVSISEVLSPVLSIENTVSGGSSFAADASLPAPSVFGTCVVSAEVCEADTAIVVEPAISIEKDVTISAPPYFTTIRRYPTGLDAQTGTWSGTYQDVDDVVTDYNDSSGDSDYMNCSANGYTRFTISALAIPAQDTIENIYIGIRQRNTSSGGTQFWPAVRILNLFNDTGEMIGQVSNETWVGRYLYVNNPGQGDNHWVPSDANNITGIGIQVGDASPSIDFSIFYVEAVHGPRGLLATASLPTPTISIEQEVSVGLEDAMSASPAKLLSPTVYGTALIQSAVAVTETAEMLVPSVSGESFVTVGEVQTAITASILAPIISGEAHVETEPALATDADILEPIIGIGGVIIAEGAAGATDATILTPTVSSTSLVIAELFIAIAESISANLHIENLISGGGLLSANPAELVVPEVKIEGVTIVLLEDALEASPAILIAPEISGESSIESEVATATASLLLPSLSVYDVITISFESEATAELITPEVAIAQSLIVELEDALTADAALPAPEVLLLGEVSLESDPATATAGIVAPDIYVNELVYLILIPTASAEIPVPAVSGTALIVSEPAFATDAEILAPEVLLEGETLITLENAMLADPAVLLSPAVSGTCVVSGETATAETSELLVPDFGITDGAETQPAYAIDAILVAPAIHIWDLAQAPIFIATSAELLAPSVSGAALAAIDTATADADLLAPTVFGTALISVEVATATPSILVAPEVKLEGEYEAVLEDAMIADTATMLEPEVSTAVAIEIQVDPAVIDPAVLLAPTVYGTANIESEVATATEAQVLAPEVFVLFTAQSEVITAEAAELLAPTVSGEAQADAEVCIAETAELIVPEIVLEFGYTAVLEDALAANPAELPAPEVITEGEIKVYVPPLTATEAQILETVIAIEQETSATADILSADADLLTATLDFAIIQRREFLGEWSIIAITTWEDQGEWEIDLAELVNGTTYWFRMQRETDGQYSDWTDPIAFPYIVAGPITATAAMPDVEVTIENKPPDWTAELEDALTAHTAILLAPDVYGTALIVSEVLEATPSIVIEPVVVIPIQLVSEVLTADADLLAPDVYCVQLVEIDPATATNAVLLAPTVSGEAFVEIDTATADAELLLPTVSGEAFVDVDVATADAEIISPDVYGTALIESDIATATDAILIAPYIETTKNASLESEEMFADASILAVSVFTQGEGVVLALALLADPATLLEPTLHTEFSLVIESEIATATDSELLAPVISISSLEISEVQLSDAELIAPTVYGEAHPKAEVCIAETAELLPPLLSLWTDVKAVLAEAETAELLPPDVLLTNSALIETPEGMYASAGIFDVTVKVAGAIEMLADVMASDTEFILPTLITNSTLFIPIITTSEALLLAPSVSGTCQILVNPAESSVSVLETTLVINNSITMLAGVIDVTNAELIAPLVYEEKVGAIEVEPLTADATFLLPRIRVYELTETALFKASAELLAPKVSTESLASTDVLTAAAEVLAPEVYVTEATQAEALLASAELITPIIITNATLYVLESTAVASFLAPEIKTGDWTMEITAVAEATAEAIAPASVIGSGAVSIAALYRTVRRHGAKTIMHDIVVNVETAIPFMALDKRNGETMTGARLSIRRISTDEWYDSGSWSGTIAYNDMTHIENGSHEYLMTFPYVGEYQLLFTSSDENMLTDSYVHTVYPEARVVSTTLRGSGATAGIVVIQQNGLPVADADVWITSDEAGLNIVAGTLQTNSQGQATFYLDDGLTYYVWGQKDGYNFDNPQEVVW